MKKRSNIANAIMLVLLGVCVALPVALFDSTPRLFLESDNRYAVDLPTEEELEALVATLIGGGEEAGEETELEAESEAREEASAEQGANVGTEAESEESSEGEPTSLIAYAVAGIDGYLDDRIGLRSEAMAGYIWSNDKIFHVMTHPTYDYGLDGYLFHSFDFYVAPDDYAELYADYVVMLKNYCEARGVTFLYVNTPSKEFVYDEYIPDYVPAKRNIFDVIAPILEENEVDYLDLTYALRQAKEEGISVFHQFYDPGHWNTAGAFVGSNAILERLADEGVDVEQADLSDYETRKVHVSSPPASVYPLDMDVDRYVRIEDGTEAVELADYEDDLELSSWAPLVYVWQNDTVENDESLLMFQGSYFNSQGTSLYHQFDRATLIHDYLNVLDVVYYMDVVHPSVVVFECADYTVRDGYYGEYDLSVADLPPLFEATYDPTLFGNTEAPVEELSYLGEAAVANFTIPCDTGNLRYAYIQIGETIYECLVRDEDIRWGVDASELQLSQTARAFLVGYDGSLKSYEFEINAE